MSLICALCQRRYPIETQDWRCTCGGVLEIAERIAFAPQKIAHKEYTLWRYRALLPPTENIVSLGEGWTPIVTIRAHGVDLLAKLEFLAPTGSFKDRGTTVLVSLLKEMSISEVVEDSSGNAAASLAAYGARAGIHCKIFVPAEASPAKLAQIRVYGAELLPIAGPREHAALAVQQAAEQTYYASHVYNPLILEGTKTFAYELWEQLGRVPDHLLFPVGHGTLFLGAYRGFCDLLQAKLIEKLPALHAVQATGYAPLYRIYRESLAELPELEPRPTIAEGIRIKKPVRWSAILQAVRATHGSIVTVTDEAILQAQQALAQQGLYVEPTAAVPVAAVRQFSARLNPKQLLLVPLTGSGLKSPALP